MTLFGTPDPDDELAPTINADDGRPSWSRLGSSTRQRCDRCVEMTFLGHSRRRIRTAAWRRTHNGAARLLCHEHTQDARVEDERR